MIKREKIKSKFVQIPNEIFKDNLSLTSIGVYGAMRSMSSKWDIYQKPFAKKFGMSQNTLKKYINQLIDKGWLSKTPRRDQRGVFTGGYDYTLHNSPKLSTTIAVDNLEAESKVDSPINTNTPDWHNLIPNKDSNDNNINTLLQTYSNDEIQAALKYVHSRSHKINNYYGYLLSSLRYGWYKANFYQEQDAKIQKLWKKIEPESKFLLSEWHKLKYLIKKRDIPQPLNDVAMQILSPSKPILTTKYRNVNTMVTSFGSEYTAFLYWLYQTDNSVVFTKDRLESRYFELFQYLNPQ